MDDTILAWQRAGFKATVPGDGFDSEIFTIVVGSEAKVYTVHAAFLSQSPVLKRMCHAGFQESQTRRISLPEEDTKVVRAMIQYLYGGDFCSFGTKEASPEETTEPADDLTQAADELAVIYIAADKYQLPDLKTLVVGKMTSHIDIQNRPIEFLQMSRRIYLHIPDSQEIFRTFFKETAMKLPKQGEMTQDLGNVFNECISDGGIMAIDLFAALCVRFTAELDAKMNFTIQQAKELATPVMMNTTIAWERGNTKTVILGAGFDSQVFTITVGSEAKAFTAHAAYLGQSPVLECICNAKFRERGTLTINLPEDEIEVIQAIIQYLYAGDFWGFGSTTAHNATEGTGKEEAVEATSYEKLAAADDLATMYITADKYQMQDLMNLVVKKIDAITEAKQQPVEFLKIARRIYASVPDSDQAYRSFFKTTFSIVANIEPKCEELRHLIEECIFTGGRLALDIVEVREAELMKKFTVQNDALAKQFEAKSEALV
ncbi:MAG: hypothetical protein LQ352_004694 [Teloschistes flavicans]|nr:MAG: hypothetical protein LQ352_004694 [Teloschistes flavicans]